MAFPNKNWFGKNKGWENMGLVEPFHSINEEGKEIKTTDVHLFCKHQLRIGKENGVLFKFCPVCLVKVDTKS